MSAPWALASSSVYSEPGHPQHVAEAGEDHAVVVGDRDAVVDPAHRDHAHRAAGAVDELDVRRAAGRRCRTCRSSACGRRTPPSPCSGGRARPRRGSRAASARPSSASRNSSTNLIGRASRWRIATPAWTSSSSPAATGADEVDRDLVQRAAVVAAQRADRRPALDHAHRDALVAAGDAVAVAAGTRSRAGARRSLDHARLQLLELLLVVGAHPLRAARAWRAPPPRRPWRARSRRGSAPSRPGRASSPSLASRLTLMLRRTPTTSTLAIWLTSSTISTTCPGIARHIWALLLLSRLGPADHRSARLPAAAGIPPALADRTERR